MHSPSHRIAVDSDILKGFACQESAKSLTEVQEAHFFVLTMVASRAEVRDGSVSTGFDLYGYFFLQRRPFGSCLIISMSPVLNGAKNRPKFI